MATTAANNICKASYNGAKPPLGTCGKRVPWRFPCIRNAMMQRFGAGDKNMMVVDGDVNTTFHTLLLSPGLFEQGWPTELWQCYLGVRRSLPMPISLEGKLGFTILYQIWRTGG
jgi:hypothetical protein